MILHLFWKEPRIIVDTSSINDMSRIHLESALMQNIWKPDIFIHDLIKFKTLKVLDPLEGLTILGNETFSLFTATIVTFSCRMLFKQYPFDVQDCPFLLTSTNHPINEIEFNGTYFSHMEHTALQTFDLEIRELEAEKKETEVNGETFSVTGVHVQLKRNYGAFLLRYFLPCCIMVIVSFNSFIIPTEAIPGRVGLLATLFLVLTALFTSVQVAMEFCWLTA